MSVWEYSLPELTHHRRGPATHLSYPLLQLASTAIDNSVAVFQWIELRMQLPSLEEYPSGSQAEIQYWEVQLHGERMEGSASTM